MAGERAIITILPQRLVIHCEWWSWNACLDE
jgi:hypothetical protein